MLPLLLWSSDWAYLGSAVDHVAFVIVRCKLVWSQRDCHVSLSSSYTDTNVGTASSACACKLEDGEEPEYTTSATDEICGVLQTDVS